MDARAIPSRDAASDAADPSPETSTILLRRASGGDRDALDRLCRRYLPRLRRWASGRLPSWARAEIDTTDLVQETLIRVVRRIESGEGSGVHEFNAYLRRAMANRLTDEIRKAKRRPAAAELDSGAPDPALSPLERAVGRETVERYEAALGRLTAAEREAIIARIEYGQSYRDVADALGKPSPDAARMAVSRALVRLAAEMRREGE